MAVVGVAMLMVFVWFAVALVFRRRFQFSLRSLLVMVLVVAIPCSWLTAKVRKAEMQEKAAWMVVRMQGSVLIDSENTTSSSSLWLGPTTFPKGWLQERGGGIGGGYCLTILTSTMFES